MFNKEEQRNRAAEFSAAFSARFEKTKYQEVVKEAVVIVPVMPVLKSTAKVNYLQESFINQFNQVIRPGDAIIAISSGYAHSVNIREATYLGLRRSYTGSVSGVVILSKISIWGWESPDGTTSKNRPRGMVAAKRAMIDVLKKTTLPGKRIYPALRFLGDERLNPL